MAIPASAYPVFTTVAAVLAAVLTALAWDRRPARGATPFAAAMFAVAFWSAAYTGELVAVDPATKLLLARLSYVGIVAFPPAWLLFALAYAGEEALVDWRAVLVLSIEPAAVLALVFTHGQHGLFWTAIEPLSHDGIVLFDYSYGPAFWAHTAYAYLLVLGGFGALLLGFSRSPVIGRRQLAGLLLAGVPPVVGNVLTLLELGPIPPAIDLTSVGFALGGVPAFVVLFRYGLLSLPDAAHERLFETLGDPVFVLDDEHRVIACNPAAESLLGASASGVEGQPLPAVLPGGDDLFDPGDDRLYRDRIELTVDGVPREYGVALSSLYHTRQDVMGRLAVLRSLDPAAAE